MIKKAGHLFSASVREYDSNADLQKSVASRLAASLAPWSAGLPPGPVLEIGAGTGFLTSELATLFPGREIVVTDLSREMLEYCRESLEQQVRTDRFRFEQMDAEAFRPEMGNYAMIGGNFVAQWFRDPALTLSRLASSLKPGGLLLVSFPGHESFPEWREACLELGLPCTCNPLPNTEEMVIKLSMGPFQVDFFEESRTVEFSGPLAFFRHLKQIGADANLNGKQLTGGQLRLLDRYWSESVAPEPVRITWHLVFLAVKRDPS